MWLEKLFQKIDNSFIGKFIDKRLDLIKATNPERIYVENIRSFYNLSTPFAKFFCEMAVKENLFKKRIGVECPTCDKLITHFSSERDFPQQITCDNCQLLEKDKHHYSKDEIKRLVFYQLNTESCGNA